jgi:hypothetical protein
MNLTKLVLLIKDIDDNGDVKWKRLDRDEFISKESIHMIKQSPILLSFSPHSKLPRYIERKKGFREITNALLIGEKIQSQYDDYYPASYCKI